MSKPALAVTGFEDGGSISLEVPVTTTNMRRCSICGRLGAFGESITTFGPGMHYFHGACINGALNYVAMTALLCGDTEPPKPMMFWPNAEKAGVEDPMEFARKIARAREDRRAAKAATHA